MYSAQTSASCCGRSLRRGVVPLFLASAVLIGAQQRLSVSASAPRVEAHPRQVITAAVQCRNEDAVERAASLQVVLPAGWKEVVDGYRFSLPPAGVEAQIVSFLVPSDARAGTYEIHFRLGDSEGASPAETSLMVTVLPEVHVRLDVIDQPPFVVAGDEYMVSFLAANDGNADARLDLSLQGGELFPFSLLGGAVLTDFPLAAGAAVVLKVSVRTPRQIPQSVRNPLRLTARSHGLPGTPPLALATAVAEVVPAGHDARSVVNTIPLTTETVGSLSLEPGLAADATETVRARGPLDETGRNTIDLLVRKQAATDADLLFNPQDQYSFRFANPLVDVRLGDHSFSISPLLLWEKPARGAQVGVTLGGLEASSFVLDDVHSPAAGGAAGGAVQYTLTGERREGEDLYRATLGAFSPLTGRALVGAWQQYRPWEHVLFQLDTAMDIHGGGSSLAVLAEAAGESGGISWDASFLRAEPDFDGAWSDVQTMSLGAGVRLLDEALRLQGKAALTERNLQEDPSRGPAEESVYVSAGASTVFPGWGTQANLSWYLLRRDDRLPSPSFRTLDNRVDLRVRQPLQGFDLGFDSTVGTARDDLLGAAQWMLRNALSGGIDVSSSLRLLGALAHTARWADAQSTQHSIGLNLGARLSSPRTSAELNLRNEWSFSAAGLGGVSGGFGGRLARVFPWEHSFTVDAGIWFTWAAAVLTPSGKVSLAYTVPIDVPVSRKRDVVAIRGSVTRRETGAPVAGVVVRLNGLASVTDSRGEFDLLLPASGTHYLQFDERSLPQGLIPWDEMPYEIDSRPGADVRLDLSVVQGCTVTGSAAMEPGTGLGGMVVELSNGRERKRRVSGADGRFVFTEVRPGNWTVSVVSGQLPSYHVVENPVLDLALASGDNGDVEFRVIPQQRRIQMVTVPQGVVSEPPFVPVSGQVIQAVSRETPGTPQEPLPARERVDAPKAPPAQATSPAPPVPAAAPATAPFPELLATPFSASRPFISAAVPAARRAGTSIDTDDFVIPPPRQTPGPFISASGK